MSLNTSNNPKVIHFLFQANDFLFESTDYICTCSYVNVLLTCCCLYSLNAIQNGVYGAGLFDEITDSSYTTRVRLCLIDTTVIIVCTCLLLKFVMYNVDVNDACDPLFGQHDYWIQPTLQIGFRG